MQKKQYLIFLICLILFPLIRTDLSESYKDLDQKIISFLGNKQRVQESNDAVGSVLSLLQDLKGSNTEEQEKADKRYTEEEAKYLAAITELQNVYDDNTQHFLSAQDDYLSIQEKKNDTTYALQWIQDRIKSNSEKIEKLAMQRCESNALFIESLREHQEGLEVLEWLQQDLENLKSKGVIFLEDDELGSFTDKLSGYSQIYEQEAIARFVKLGEEKLADTVGLIDITGGSDIKENESGDSKVDDGNVKGTLTSHVLDMVEELINKLDESIQNLEKYEIQASREFASFKSKINSETNLFKQEFDSKTVYLGKLKIDEEVALTVLNKAEETMKKSEALLSSNIEEYNNKKNFYMAEKSRREEENEIIDEVIVVYKEKVYDAQQYLKDKVEDFVEDGFLDKTRASSKKKRTDVLIEEAGKIKEIVEKQSKMMDEDMDIDSEEEKDDEILEDEDLDEDIDG